MIRSIVRLILQFTYIVTVYNIYFWVRMYSTYSTRYIFLIVRFMKCKFNFAWRWETLFLPYVLHENDKPLHSIRLLSTKKCFRDLVFTVLCFCRWIETILFFESTICDEFFSYFDVQQIRLYWINASIVFILLMRYINIIEIITLFVL
jgi:hypothetical protein